MLATMVEHVIGIDPDRDRVTASVVDTATTGEQASAVFATTRRGYDQLLVWANQHTPARRAWAVEGAGSYGAGVASYLTSQDERVVEFNNPHPTRDGAKTDALDARRAARQVLGRSWPAVPRTRGQREALRVLETTRQGAQNARVTAINALKALVITAPIDLRDQLRDLNTTALVTKTSKFRSGRSSGNELASTKQAMRSLARRIKTLTTEIAELRASITALVETVAPQLLQQPGVGPITAAQVYIAWSHPRRCRTEAAFARLAGVAPLEASSGQRTRHRLNRYGDRTLNRALYIIAITRTRTCPRTRAYIAKRTTQGKTTREARRCLKRYIARHLYRLLENPPPTDRTNQNTPAATPATPCINNQTNHPENTILNT